MIKERKGQLVYGVQSKTDIVPKGNAPKPKAKTKAELAAEKIAASKAAKNK